MKKFWLITLALAAVLAVAPSAKADSFYVTVIADGPGGGNQVTGTGLITVSGGLITYASFTFTGGVTGKGTLIQIQSNLPQGEQYVPGQTYYDIVSLDGSHVVSQVTSTQPNNTNYFGFDNVLISTSQSPFDWSGILLQIDGGVLNFFCDTDGACHWAEYSDSGWVTNPVTNPEYIIPAEFILTSAPEPSSLSLLGTGLLAFAGFLFWKAKNGLVQAA